MTEAGSRVGAFISLDRGVVSLLGYGIYEGDEPVDIKVEALVPLYPEWLVSRPRGSDSTMEVLSGAANVGVGRRMR